MTAQPVESPRAPVAPIPRTIDAIADALRGEKRMAFYAAVGQAQQGRELDEVMSTWWMEAMFDTHTPGREGRLADCAAGRNLVPLPEVPAE